MFDTFSVPIAVHCAIPNTECKPSILSPMAHPDESGVDETLAKNFGALMGDRSVAVLRQEMADKGITIGSGAIQGAKAGSRGLRLETLQKFADFFGCSIQDLLTPVEKKDAWPFGSALTRAQFEQLDSAAIQAALDVLVSAAKRQAVTEKFGASLPAIDEHVGRVSDPAPPQQYRGRDIKPHHPAKPTLSKGRGEK